MERELEVTIISADLELKKEEEGGNRNVCSELLMKTASMIMGLCKSRRRRRRTKMQALYAVAYFFENGERRTTHVDTEGGASPRWWAVLPFVLPEDLIVRPAAAGHVALSVEIYELRSSGRRRSSLVGVTRVPLQDILRAPNQQKMAFQLLRHGSSGRPAGSVRLSVFLGKRVPVVPRQQQQHHHHHTPVLMNGPATMVVGYPLPLPPPCCPYPTSKSTIFDGTEDPSKNEQ